MTFTATAQYKGALRTEATHLRSNTIIVTDAPIDNNGKGESFSPTDMVAAALASCMLTIMGIKAANKGLDIEGTKAEVKKIMASDPRRISKVIIKMHMPERSYSHGEKKMLKKAAITCPVSKSLAADLEQDVEFIWSE